MKVQMKIDQAGKTIFENYALLCSINSKRTMKSCNISISFYCTPNGVLGFWGFGYNRVWKMSTP